MKKRGDEEDEEDKDNEVVKDFGSKKSSLSPPAPPACSFFLPTRNRASSATANATAAGHSRHASSRGRSLET